MIDRRRTTSADSTDIPAGYTYLGQFIAHDTTFDTACRLERQNEPAPMTATEALDLGLAHRHLPEERLVAVIQATAARLVRVAGRGRRAQAICLLRDGSPPFSRAPDLEGAGFLAAGSTRAAVRALKPFLEDMEHLAHTPFLADPGPWVEGTRFDLVD